jgi:putative membrane protein
MKFLIRWIISAVALFVAVKFVPGIEVEGNAYVVILITALILGFLNAVLRPILTLLSCGFVVLTLGLFMFVINAVVLWLSAYIAQMFGIGFYVNGFMPALLGSIVISLISLVLSVVLKDE